MGWGAELYVIASGVHHIAMLSIQLMYIEMDSMRNHSRQLWWLIIHI